VEQKPKKSSFIAQPKNKSLWKSSGVPGYFIDTDLPGSAPETHIWMFPLPERWSYEKSDYEDIDIEDFTSEDNDYTSEEEDTYSEISSLGHHDIHSTMYTKPSVLRSKQPMKPRSEMTEQEVMKSHLLFGHLKTEPLWM